jgi:molecular chaperone GrpE
MTEENKNAPEVEQSIDEAQSPAQEMNHEQQIATLQQLLNEGKDAFLRAKAESENIRRRAIEDVAKAHKFALESFAEHLLPVMDSMHAALAHHNDDLNKLKEGVELTLKQLTGALEKGRIVEINPEAGAKFDPHLHQAISMVESNQEANTVVTVLQKGYLIADRVLRPALVTVSQTK